MDTLLIPRTAVGVHTTWAQDKIVKGADLVQCPMMVGVI